MAFALLKPSYTSGIAQATYRYTTQPKLYWAVYLATEATPTAEQLLFGYPGTAALAGFEDARTDSGDHELAPIDVSGLAPGSYKAGIVWYDGETFSTVSETAAFVAGGLSIDPTSYSSAFANVTLSYSGSGAALDIDAGSYSAAFSTVTMRVARKMPIAAASYSTNYAAVSLTVDASAYFADIDPAAYLTNFGTVTMTYTPASGWVRVARVETVWTEQ